MIIYRWQDGQARGPYFHGGIQFAGVSLRSHNAEHGRPDPYSDGITFDDKDRVKDWDVCGHVLYGFKSVEQMHNWFDPQEVDWMQANGYRLVRFDVQDEAVYHGRRQLIFNSNAAKEI
jgi:hypothetical protein